jgi:hypothetical protein
MLKRALSFLCLTGYDGNLSITNIAVIVCVVKMATAAQFTGVDAGALLATLLNYAHRRQAGANDQT